MHRHLACAVCQRPLQTPRALHRGTCERRACRAASLRRLRERRERRREKLLEGRQRQTLVAEQHLAKSTQPRPGPTQLVVLPANRRPVTNLPDRRKRRFRDHLLRTISAAAELLACLGGTEKPAIQVEHDQAADTSLPVLDRACATCEGKCCAAGAEHAYLDVKSVLAYFQRHPHLRPCDIFDAFYGQVPQRTYEGSCVFHTAVGCALPRDMRAFTCLEFYCDNLQPLRARPSPGPADGIGLVAMEGLEVIRWDVVPCDGMTGDFAANASASALGNGKYAGERN